MRFSFLLISFIAIITCGIVAQPTSVKLLTPKGGESFRAGSSQDLKWDTTGTLGALWTFQFGTSPTGPWTNLSGAIKVLDSAAKRGVLAGGFRVPAVKTSTGYVRIVLTNTDGTLNESVSDINDQPFTIIQPEAAKADSTLKDPIAGKVTLSSSKIYSLDGYVFVDDGGELHIQPGTIIIGDTVGQNSAICVNRGGKIFAIGTKDKPIIMTSSAPVGQRMGGDWGGLLICGRASTNHPGGEAALEGKIADIATKRGFFGGGDNPDDNDNSGIIDYLRIEFAGIAADPNQELNSLTLGAVGRGTKISNIQVSYANDDAIEWFGGTVDLKNAVIIGTLDDDLDGDNGWSGRVQFVSIQRFKNRADVSTSQSFEIDNNSSGSYATPFTRPVFSNVTSIGPIQEMSWTPDATGVQPNTYHNKFGAAAQIRRNARASIFNSVFVGWPRGLDLLSIQGQTAAANDSLMIRNNSYFGIKNEILRIDGTTPAISKTWLDNGYNNTFDVASTANANLTNPYTVGLGFNPIPKADANYLNSAHFDNGNAIVNIADPFFEKVSYRGAFSSEIALRWDLPWAEYDPINKLYLPSSINDNQYINQLGVNIYPNPAVDNAKIIYNIPNNDYVTIKIYDNMGKNIATIADNLYQTQNYYEFNINTTNLVAGTYFVRIITNNGTITKNLNVVK